MSFTRVWPAGLAANDPPTAAALNQLDIDHANSIDGAAGGAYTPAAQISLGGAGLKLLSAPLDLWDAAGTPVRCFWFDPDVAGSGAAPAINTRKALIDIKDAGGVQRIYFEPDVAGSGTAAVLDVAVPIVLQGAARIAKRRVEGTDANTHFDVTTTDQVTLANAVLTGGKTYYADNTGAVDGNEISFFTADVTNILTVSANGGALTINLKYLSGQAAGVTLMFDGTNWRIVRIEQVP